nr:MAG TPA: hypothetical protein [Caudoviricetes sp.]
MLYNYIAIRKISFIFEYSYFYNIFNVHFLSCINHFSKKIAYIKQKKQATIF